MAASSVLQRLTVGVLTGVVVGIGILSITSSFHPVSAPLPAQVMGCGQAGQPCCLNNTCQAGLACLGGLCQGGGGGGPVCGGQGEMCTNDADCCATQGLVCISGRCAPNTAGSSSGGGGSSAASSSGGCAGEGQGCGLTGKQCCTGLLCDSQTMQCRPPPSSESSSSSSDASSSSSDASSAESSSSSQASSSSTSSSSSSATSSSSPPPSSSSSSSSRTSSSLSSSVSSSRSSASTSRSASSSFSEKECAPDYQCRGDIVSNNATQNGCPQLWMEDTICPDGSSPVWYPDQTNDTCALSATCRGRCGKCVTSSSSSIAWVNLCGDGSLDPGEECDDGNTRDGDCCSGLCRTEPNCICSVENVPTLSSSSSLSQSSGSAVGTCRDSDGGMVPAVKGTVTFGATPYTQTFNDSCLDAGTIIEWLCLPDGLDPQWVHVPCPGGAACVDGACQ